MSHGKEWIFTFGFSHYHLESGRPLSNAFVRICAVSADAARMEMVRRFGQEWGFQYDSEAAAGVDRFNLWELDA